MPAGRRKKTSFRFFPATYVLFLVKIILIKIGEIPLKIVYRIHRRRAVGRPKKLRFSKKTKIALASGVFLLFISSYTAFILTAAYALPTPSKMAYSNNPLTTEIYDRNGNLLYRFYEAKNRTLVQLSEIPKSLTQATLAIEDQNFYRHFGVDFSAIIRAFYQNATTGSRQGASTITQQLIKNSLLTPERTYTRKIREVILALWTEQVYSKDQILQMYFNEAPYGGAIVGIGAASQTYFGKSPSELSLAESTYLAGLPASPTQFSPYGENPELAKQRQKEILQRMVVDKYITQYQADEAYSKKLNIKPLANDILAPHFVFYIKDQLVDKLGPRVVSQGGLKVYTTLDLNLQGKIEQIVKDEVDKLQNLNVQNGAAMVTDGTTGQILAMVGSRDYHYPSFGNYNVTLSLRQPGSSIKPITYATAFKNGFNPGSMILDVPVVFKDEWGNSYSPVNYDGTFHGPVTLRQALGSSLNIPAVKLLATLGVNPVIETARNLGITTFTDPKRYGLSLTLGGAEVKMIDMMGSYGAFSQMGKLNTPTGIIKVTDFSGHILDEYKNSPKQVLSADTAYLVTNILTDEMARKMAFGPHSLLYIPSFDVAVKTGTSDNKRDNWTFGYTPKYVVGVWVGNPDNSPMNPALTSGVTGAAPIWNKIMHTLLDNTAPLAFEKPSILGAAGTIPKAMVKVQKKGDKLIFSDAFSSYSTPSAQAATLEITTN
ncbi:penicillin-binding protein 1C [Candidatus Daviesbacteria bacterium]|nr:penicillin-binding protein 1C [Candidatus Daviesbacteria bacterium]